METLIKKAGKRRKSTFTKLYPVLLHCGQRRGCIGADREIVKTDNAYILRYAVAQLLALDNRCAGQLIMTAYYGGTSHFKRRGMCFCRHSVM